MVDGHPVTVVHADGSRSSRAARVVRDHDLDAFRVRPDPVSPVAGPEPGLTVPWPE